MSEDAEKSSQTVLLWVFITPFYFDANRDLFCFSANKVTQLDAARGRVFISVFVSSAEDDRFGVVRPSLALDRLLQVENVFGDVVLLRRENDEEEEEEDEADEGERTGKGEEAAPAGGGGGGGRVVRSTVRSRKTEGGGGGGGRVVRTTVRSRKTQL